MIKADRDIIKIEILANVINEYKSSLIIGGAFCNRGLFVIFFIFSNLARKLDKLGCFDRIINY